MSSELLHPDWIRWLTALKDRVETLPSISAEQVITGTFNLNLIPPIPWTWVLKTGSSLGDLETRSAADLSSGTLLDARMPALTGDASSTVGTVATTLATVNPSPGTFGSGTKIPLITVNGKGLVTLVTEQPIQTGALTRVNDTNVTATLGGAPATALLKAVSITLGWTGLLGLSRGGTHADLSATGGAGKYLKQASAGADVTVSSITAAEITAGAALTKVDDTNVTLALGGSPASALLAATSLTLGWTGTLSVARGGTGGGTAFTAGSVVFAGASGVYAQDNANLFWDDTNNWLGIGTAAPAVKLHTYLTQDNSVVRTTIARFERDAGSVGPAAGRSAELVFADRNNPTLTGTLAFERQNAGANFRGDFALYLNVGGAAASALTDLTERLRIAGNGGFTFTSTSAATFTFTGTTGGAAFSVGHLDFNVVDAGVGTITDVARVARTGAAGVAAERAVGISFSDANNATLVAGVAGLRPNSSVNFQGGLAFYVANVGGTGASAAAVMSDLTEVARWTRLGQLGIGTVSPTALVHIKAGTATASTAPFKFTSGTLLTTPEAGAQEFLTDDYFATITTGAARKAFVLDDGSRLTSGKVPVATTNGRLIDGPTLGAAGLKIPAIQANGYAAAQTAAVASVATWAGATADCDVIVTAFVSVTTSVLHNFGVQIDYTDPTNTARTETLTFTQLSAASVSAITNGTGTGPYSGVLIQVRCKASTSITAKTTGTFTSVTYDVGASFIQIG